MSSTPRLAALTCLCLTLGSCQMAGDRGFRLLDDVTDFSDGQILDDMIVWPVQARGAGLEPVVLDEMTKRLHAGMRDREYSVISRPMVDHLASQYGTDDGAALRALEQAKADGVLVLRITKWDERGLLNLGRIRAEGQLKLLGPGGRVIWQTRLRCDDELVRGPAAPRDVDARRLLVVERLADLVAARLPPHRV